MADHLVFLFTISTFMSVVCLMLVFLVSWQYESMFLELAVRVNHQEQNMIQFKRIGSSNSVNGSNNSGSVQGVTFTRWGYGECPEMTELVYSGGMVNVLSNASVPQCFPLSPSELDRIHRQETIQKTSEVYYSIPCAVCYSKRHSTVLLQPARHTCTSGWSLMYEGSLAANEGSLLCMDSSLKSLQGSHTRTMNGYHYVKASCDVLPCPPYDDTSNLTCTVCIK